MSTTKLWIARDRDKGLHIFIGYAKPQKMESAGRWFAEKLSSYCRPLCEVPHGLKKWQLYHDLDALEDVLFPNVRWEDNEPTELVTL